MKRGTAKIFLSKIAAEMGCIRISGIERILDSLDTLDSPLARRSELMAEMKTI